MKALIFTPNVIGQTQRKSLSNYKMKLTEMLAIVEEIVTLENDFPLLKARIEEAQRLCGKAPIGAERAKANLALYAIQDEQTVAFDKHKELNDSLPPREECPDAAIIMKVARSNVRVKRIEMTLADLQKELAEELAKPNPNSWKRTVAKESAAIVEMRNHIEVCEDLIPKLKKSNISIHTLWTKMVDLEKFDEDWALYKEGKGPLPASLVARMDAQRRELEKGCIPYEPPADLGAIFNSMRR